MIGVHEKISQHELNLFRKEPWPINMVLEMATLDGFIPDEDIREGYENYSRNKSHMNHIASYEKLVTNSVLNGIKKDNYREMIFLRYKKHKTLGDIASIYHIGKERVRQIIIRSLYSIIGSSTVPNPSYKFFVENLKPISKRVKYVIFCKHGRLLYFDQIHLFSEITKRVTINTLYDTSWFDEDPKWKYIAKYGVEKYINNLETDIESLKLENTSLRHELGIKEATHDIPEIPIMDLDLSYRASHCLIRYGCKTTKDVSRMSVEELLRISGVGHKTFDEIISKMNKLGIKLDIE